MKQKQLSMRWRRQDHKQQRQPNHYRKRHYRKTKWVHTKPRLYGGVFVLWERLLSSESGPSVYFFCMYMKPYKELLFLILILNNT